MHTQDADTALDFEAMVKAERKAAQAAQKKVDGNYQSTPVSELYNALQRQPGEGLRPIILDCRVDEDDFKHSHVRDAIFVEVVQRNGNQEVHANVQDGIMTTRQKLALRGDVIVIVYDVNSKKKVSGSDDKDVGVTQKLAAVIDYLKAEGVAKKVAYVDGGFEAIQKQYPAFCVSDKASDEDLAALRNCHPAEIVGGRVYIGTQEQAANSSMLKALGITHVLNVGDSPVPIEMCADEQSEAQAVFAEVTFKNLFVADDPSTVLPVVEAVEFVSQSISQDDGKVLVCCKTGISTSAAISAAFMMSVAGHGTMQAVTYVMKRWRRTKPNAGFFSQLGDLEDTLKGANSNLLLQ
eukprot:GFYU01001731.1.p1 GENE.GFYU01001731.1~~GFYU01001731.1.p1  ORF type:complete len:351 (+),score=82.01 GFYU01001731.1:125-1177(+)